MTEIYLDDYINAFENADLSTILIGKDENETVITHNDDSLGSSSMVNALKKAVTKQYQRHRFFYNDLWKGTSTLPKDNKHLIQKECSYTENLKKKNIPQGFSSNSLMILKSLPLDKPMREFRESTVFTSVIAGINVGAGFILGVEGGMGVALDTTFHEYPKAYAYGMVKVGITVTVNANLQVGVLTRTPSELDGLSITAAVIKIHYVGGAGIIWFFTKYPKLEYIGFAVCIGIGVGGDFSINAGKFITLNKT
ncbi:hypothetical protein [Candidatus Albibeggiatoa sp. nov. BB20]|uniref:hypothetical protein n=1 Tax=Candidatus Albibeggiatoa sp. nov. BB20 TaxID=3162723 RepID=UPI0033653E97